jgi:hypothetical protein
MKRVLAAAAFLLLSVFFTNTFAQTTNATLGGTVSDSSKALMPGVMVTATNTGTGIVSTSLTNETGAYNFPSLQTGTYKVTAELPGFQTQTYNDITLGLSQQLRLNFNLQVSTQSQSVEVSVAADTLIATTSSSVGSVLPEYKVRDLPLATRNILDLVNTTPGVGGTGSNFAGGRVTQLNTTRDGIPVSDGRYDIGAATTTYTSPDLVEEVRVIVAPADAETGRGSGQISMVTRSGTNQFRGSLFWVNRNSFLNSNSWNNNFNGIGKDYSNGNQFGGRVGGPINKNKTFFFFLFDGQRFLTKSSVDGIVLTPQARQGLFRFFPGAQNANALANAPTVDRAGNPIKPALATGDLQSQTVFGRDQNRLGPDASGWIARLLTAMPLPNDYTIGDGLNTAGIRWLRPNHGVDVANGDGQDTDRNQYNIRLDHNFNARHKASFSGTWESDSAETSQAGLSPWPGGFNGNIQRSPRIYTGSLVSTLSSTIVNEFRVGFRQSSNYSWSSIWRPDAIGNSARAALPVHGNTAFVPQQALITDNPFFASVNPPGAATRGQQSPLYDYSDTLSWTKAKHAFKAGYEARFTSSSGYNGSNNPDWVKFPIVTVGGAQNVAVTGINTIPGLVGTNVTTMQNLLLDLSGNVSGVTLAFNVHSPTDQVFTPDVRVKDYHQNEWGGFFKDDWKVRTNLTLNLGVRYDFYGVPWEKSGMQALPVGGGAGLFGISGTSFADMWQPGHLAGSLTQLQLVGKNSNHPNTLLYNNDWNNVAPAIGLSWSVPWGGKDKTVLRAGYGISYQGAASFNGGLNIASGNNPGLQFTQNLTTLNLGASAFNFSSPNLPVPVPAPTVAPLTTEPLNVRINPLSGFDQHRVNPYVQNYNLEIQREIANNLTFEGRYIGSKGTKLYAGVSIDDVNIFENGILDNFNITRQGGDAPLFNTMLNGLTLNPGTNATLGQGVINGTTLSGSAALRANSIFKTFLANGQVGSFASALNASTTVTGQAGGLVKNGKYPDNFIVANPQYAAVVMNTNPGSSTYHAMTLQVTKRLSHGFTNSFGYTWSRTLGESGTDGNIEYLNPRNAHLNHGLLGFHRTHDIRSNGTLELPFGPGKKFLSGAPSIITRLVERWQLGGIFSWGSGAPLTLTASTSQITFTQVPGQIGIASTPNTANILGAFPKSTGKITPNSSGANYFAGFTQVDDPYKTSVTNLQTLQGSFSNKAIADANGNIVLANPAPGVAGTLGRAWLQGPSHVGFNANLVKRIRLTEQKNFEIRVDVVNVLNTPYWNDPTTDINSASFGRMTAADVTTGGSNADNRSANRRFTFNARLNF